MGQDMASVDAAFGLEPYEKLYPAHMYAVVTSVAVEMNVGDMVERVGEAVATPKLGNLMKVVTEETGATGDALIAGVVLALFDENMDPVERIAASETGDGTIAGYALVADHPEQRYIVQEDGDTSSLQVADIGLNIDTIKTGTPAASNSYKSTMEIDSDTVNTTATLAMRILGVHPDDTISSDGSAGNYCRFIVKFNPEVFHSVGVLA